MSNRDEKGRLDLQDQMATNDADARLLAAVRQELDRSCAALDGGDEKLLQWITDSGLVALIADNYAVEVHPATPHAGACATLPRPTPSSSLPLDIWSSMQISSISLSGE